MKKNLTFAKLVMLVVMATLPFSMMAQEGKKKSKPAEKYFYIQLDGGLSINHGDLANYTGGVWDDFNHYKSTAFKNWDAHFGLGYQFGKVIGMNLKGGYGLLSGHKHGQPLIFFDGQPAGTYTDLALDKTNYIEGNLNLTFNLFNMFKYNPRRVINFVPHIGIGGTYYKAGVVSQLNNDDEVEGTLAEASEKRGLTYTVPAGMEITLNLAPKFDLFFDYTYLFTGKDDLDHVMKGYTEGYNTEEGRIINDKDMYSQFNMGLRIKFNNPCDIDKMARNSKKITSRVNPDPLVEGEDGNVCFDVIVTIPEEYFEKQAVMNLQPYLAYKGGQIDIDPITFVGEKVKGEGDFRVNYKEGGEFTKHYCMPYQPEMENCELKADPMFYVYNGTIYPTQDEIVKNEYFAEGSTVKLADGVIANEKCEPVTDLKVVVNDDNTVNVSWTGNANSYDVILKNGEKVVKTVNVKGNNQGFDNLELGTDYVVTVVAKCTDKDSDATSASFSTHATVGTPADFTFYFPKDSWDINSKSINKDVRAALLAKLKEDAEIKGFKVEGWASPEGEYERNDKLADNRSASAKSDIEKQIKKAGKKTKNFEINIKGNGPDWNKFMELVKNSSMKDKDAIINNVNNSGNKEQTIREMIDIYPELEKEILPLIRRAEVYIIK